MQLYTNSFDSFRNCIIPRVELKSKEYAVRMQLHPLEIRTNVSLDYASECMIVELYTQVYERDMRAVTFSFPADWIQAFKKRWFPNWLLKKYPVKNKDYIIQPKEFYSMLSCPDKNGSISLHVTNTNMWEYTNSK